MPRHPFTEISANIPRGKELTPYTRSKIATLREEGAEIGHISDLVRISQNTIKKTIKSDPHRDNSVTLKRTGRPRKYTERDKRRIIHFIRINPKSMYQDICQNTDLKLSSDTLSRILNSVGIKNWRAKGRPSLEPQDARSRYAWALIHYR
jgi:transposase